MGGRIRGGMTQLDLPVNEEGEREMGKAGSLGGACRQFSGPL